MTKDQLMEQILPAVGGRENVGRNEVRSGFLFVMVKDRSLVDLEALRGLDGVTAAEISRTRLKVAVNNLENENEEERPMAKDYTQLAKDIVRLVGTEENVISLTHCITRLRFKLKDESKADDDAISQLTGVIQVLKANGQYMVVIGNAVTKVYDAIGANTGVKLAGDVEADDGGAAKGNLVGRLIDTISGIFLPALPAMTAAGMLKAFIIMFSTLGVLSEESSTYTVLYSLADGFFMFMPIFLGYNAAVKFKCNPFMAMVVAAGLCYPNLAALAEPNVFGIPFVLITYTSSVMPIIVAVWFQSKVEPFFKKIIPEVIEGIFAPIFTVLVVYLATLFIVGPVTDWVGSTLAGLLWALLQAVPLLAGLLIAGLWPITIIFGMHWGFVPIIFNNIGTLGYDFILPITVGTNFAVPAACLAVFLRTKDKELKQTAGAASASALLGGITEPGIYGVLLKFKKPFYWVCIGCAIGGVIPAMAGLTQSVMLTTCVPTIPVIGTVVGWLDVAALAVASVVAFLGTFFFGFNDNMILGNKKK